MIKSFENDLPPHPGRFTRQVRQQKRQVGGTGSGSGHTDHLGGHRVVRSSKGRGRGALSSQWEQDVAPPLVPFSPLQVVVVVVVVVWGPLVSQAWVGGRSGSRGPRRGRSRTPCP